MKLIGAPLSGSVVVVTSGTVDDESHDQRGTQPRERLHPQPARLPVFGSKYAPDPVPTSPIPNTIQPEFWLHADPVTGHGWDASFHTVVGQLILTPDPTIPWEKLTHHTLPIQKLPDRVPSESISQLQTLKLTFPGYQPPRNELPPTPLQPFWRKKIPLSRNDGLFTAHNEPIVMIETRRARNILPFMKNIYDWLTLYSHGGKNQKKSLHKSKKLLYCITSVFTCTFLIFHFTVSI